jgi:hypothetical protein
MLSSSRFEADQSMPVVAPADVPASRAMVPARRRRPRYAYSRPHARVIHYAGNRRVYLSGLWLSGGGSGNMTAGLVPARPCRRDGAHLARRGSTPRDDGSGLEIVDSRAASDAVAQATICRRTLGLASNPCGVRSVQGLRRPSNRSPELSYGPAGRTPEPAVCVTTDMAPEMTSDMATSGAATTDALGCLRSRPP